MKAASDTNAAEQAERARLREDYLRTLAAMSKKAVEIKMYDNVTIYATFKAWYPDGHKMLVLDADLPMGGTLPSAILRCSDVISIDFAPQGI